ncbi:septation protein SepH [Pseudonocardia endophytica]|uniref:DUF3071 family protein n=1 Tax=Pseudonocardia endophytica TaxID=401976 RepID=A0A4R1HW10_PSEEN|nr:septation protein SepH [Pseudonocardia endophytica]TCK26934.1 DUF3071 family protein [Pseudonocardia endophytica]
MRALRVVGVTGDGSVVLEDPGRRERYTVPADEQLRAAARGDVTRLGQIAIELESQLRPREIQARIRGGASVAQVAEAAGVPVQKIERFAYPVLLERSRTAELAQGAHPQRADGPDLRTLGETVAHTFGLRGQDYNDADWDSWKGDDGKWVVALSWRAGRSDNAAHWAFQPGAHGGTVSALDEHASDLVEGLPARPLRTVGPVIDIGRDDEPPQEPDEPETPQARAAVAGETRGDQRRRIAPEQRRSSPATPPARSAPSAPATPPTPPPAPPARPSQPDPAPAEPAASEPAAEETVASEPAPIEEPPDVDLTAPEPAAPVAEEPAAVTEREPEVNGAQEPEPAAHTDGDGPATQDDGPAEEAEKPARPGGNRGTAASRRTKKGKPVMPSWDEVLLGVRGQR